VKLLPGVRRTMFREDVLKQLSAPDDQMRASGLPGRVFPAVGNHETWDDSDVQGLLSAFPYLKQFGVSDKRLIYKFDFAGARLIFLSTGKYDYRSPSGWDATRPAYEGQMNELEAVARLRSCRRRARAEDQVHAEPLPTVVGRTVRDRAVVRGLEMKTATYLLRVLGVAVLEAGGIDTRRSATDDHSGRS
jgi:hypothetical protein